MERASDADHLAAEIRNAAWWVRYYSTRGRAGGVHQLRRAQAIHRLGLTVRRAFGASDDFEKLLVALVDALTTRDYIPPF